MASLVQLAQFALTLTGYREELLSQFDRLLLGVGLEYGKPPDYFLGLGERAIGNRQLPADSRTRAPRALGRQPSVPSNQPAFIPSSISLPILSISACEGGAPLDCLIDTQESHCDFSFVLICFESS
jgi:hypothetical protein